jgi:parvulin-like peptidyl-prolyl isomerase
VSRFRVPLVVLALLAVAGACASDEAVSVGDQSLDHAELVAENATVAAAAGAELSQDELDALLGTTPGVTDKAAAAEVITSWVRTEAFYAGLAERGVTFDAAVFDSARGQLEQIAAVDPTLPDLDSELGDTIVRQQALGLFLDRHLREDVGVEVAYPEQLCASHILLETEAEAEAAIVRLEAGEDFAELAVELSVGPTGPTGGDLGCADPAGYVPEFSAGAAAVDPPGISEPVETQFGWHVIQVRSFESSEPATPDERLPFLVQTPEFTEFQDDVLAVEVDLDPAYGTWSTEAFAVVPG